MHVELTITTTGRKIVLDELPALIGRSGSAEVNLDDSFVGGYQCILAEEGSKLRVLDLGSKTGTFVNGRRVQRVATLMPGDRLTVGKTHFVVQYGDAATDAVPAKPRTARSSS